jgi:hypothetical protein
VLRLNIQSMFMDDIFLRNRCFEKGFGLTIFSIKIWTYHLRHTTTKLSAALSAGTKTNDLNNSFIYLTTKYIY